MPSTPPGRDLLAIQLPATSQCCTMHRSFDQQLLTENERPSPASPISFAASEWQAADTSPPVTPTSSHHSESSTSQKSTSSKSPSLLKRLFPPKSSPSGTLTRAVSAPGAFDLSPDEVPPHQSSISPHGRIRTPFSRARAETLLLPDHICMSVFLESDNYTQWAAATRDALEKHGLWWVVEAPEMKSEAERERYTEAVWNALYTSLGAAFRVRLCGAALKAKSEWREPAAFWRGVEAVWRAWEWEGEKSTVYGVDVEGWGRREIEERRRKACNWDGRV